MKHRYELSLFSFYDHTGLVKHCERMALKGWRLCRINNLHQYEKCRPQPLRFAVTYSPKVSGFEPEVPEEQADMEALCRAAGWKLAARSGQMQVFYNEDPDPVPLDTDPDIQIDVIHRTMKTSYLPAHILLALVAVLQIITQVGQLKRGSGIPLYGGPVYVFSGTSWLTIFTWSALLVLYLLELGLYRSWYRRARRRAEEGLMTPSPNTLPVQCLALFFLALTILSWIASNRLREMVLIMLGVLLIVVIGSVWLTKWMKRLKVPAKTNRLVTLLVTLVLAFALVGGLVRSELFRDRQDYAGTYEYQGTSFRYYDGDIPLRLGDLGYEEAQGDSARSEVQYSPLIHRRVCSHRPRMDALERPELTYVIADIRFKPLWDICLRDFLGDSAQTVDAAPWDADQAWKIQGTMRTTYILCWGNRMVYLQLEEDLTDAQKHIVGQKLKP